MNYLYTHHLICPTRFLTSSILLKITPWVGEEETKNGKENIRRNKIVGLFVAARLRLALSEYNQILVDS